MLSRRFALVVFVSCLLMAPAAMAWGLLGHRVVAALAWRQMTPAARAAATKLLASGHADSLVDVASWADHLRHDSAHQRLWKRTRRMHYINFSSSDCQYKPQRQCRNGECVVAAIEHYEAILGNRDLPASQRLRALKFVVHFIGDIHQPLHAGYKHDAGGNFYQVHFEGEGSNLHRVWDSGLIDTRGMTWKNYANFLAAEGPVKLPSVESGVAPPVQWAEESCRITRRIYPSGHKIGQAYVDKYLPTADHRLREAGARLAKTLNRILG